MVRRMLAVTLLSGLAGLTAFAQQDCPLAARWEPANPGNYTGGQPHKIDFVVIHTMEGSKQSAINWFKNPQAKASANFAVGFDGEIVQMVAEKDIAWHAGNWNYNTRAIGIEHEGWAGQNLWTEDQLAASARLTAYVCKKYGIPPDRQHIIGHKEVPTATHWDPGPHFNWDGYMARVQQILSGKTAKGGGAGGSGVSRGEREKLLTEAAEAEKKKDWVKAAELYKRVAFDSTQPDLAKRAREKLAVFEKDGAIAKALKAESEKQECRRWLGMARTYSVNGLHGKALDFFLKAVSLYPSGDHVAECRQKISEIEKRLRPEDREDESGRIATF